jgi:membrane fusion protein, multidrug efflux system
MRTHTVVLSLSLALLGALAGCSKKAATAVASEAPPVTVPYLVASAGPMLMTVPVTGSLVSSSSVDVKAETIGRIVRFDKEAGDHVAAGETVVWVNDENYQLSVRQAETALKVADATIERARVGEAHARAELERAQNLLRSGGITDKDLKAAQLSEADARAQVTLVTAQRDEAEAALNVARKHVRDTVIKAPVTGTIQRKFINKGAYVEAPTQLLSIVDNTKLELDSAVPSSDLAPVRSGQKVTFTVNTFPGERFTGTVIELAPAVEADTRAAKVRIQVAATGGKLRAGMFAEGAIETGTKAQVVTLPTTAVYRDDRSAKASYVFVVENGKAAKRAVRLGLERDGRIEVVEGLKAGETIIGEQSLELADGVRVQPRS